jgi:ankyrin repeat protein
MYSTLSIEINDEIIRINVYDEHGYLPIHRAALNGQETVLRMILDDAQKRNELTLQLEALTRNGHEMTPLLLATTAGRLETIACLARYPVNFNAIDGDGRGR